MSGASSLTVGEATRQLDSLETTMLDKQRRLITSLINERAWRVVKRLGHKYYREVSMDVTFIEKNEVSLVHINGIYENHHQETEVVLDVPVKLFEGVLRPHTLTQESDV